MDFTGFIIAITFGLFLGMIMFLELGRRIGIRKMSIDPEGVRTGTGAIEGAIFALLGLLIAFTFSGAASRLDARRQLIVEEANAIGTAYLRLELLSGDVGNRLRDNFRRYVDTRLALYKKFTDGKAAQEAMDNAAALQGEIWAQTVAACREQGSQSATMLLLPALNQMIDITTTRAMVAKRHPPVVIFVMLGMLALTSALLAGYGMAPHKSPSWIHIIGFSAITAFTVFVIMDIEYPRLGLIRIDQADQILFELRQSMR